MSVPAETAEHRAALYEGLLRRNRLVRILRIGLPVIGLVLFAGLAGQIVIASFLGQYGISNIIIDRDNLTVETPAYSSVAADGTMFTISSREARASMGNTDLLQLEDSELTVTKPDGSWMKAGAQSSQLRLSSQSVTVPGSMVVTDSNGTRGEVREVEADLLTESLQSSGPARIEYSSGVTIDAQRMGYDGKARLWTFDRATLTIPQTDDPAALEPNE